MAQARLVEGWENDFYKLNENGIAATRNWGYFANDTVLSPSAGRVRCGIHGDWDDDYNDPYDDSGAAWQIHI